MAGQDVQQLNDQSLLGDLGDILEGLSGMREFYGPGSEVTHRISDSYSKGANYFDETIGWIRDSVKLVESDEHNESLERVLEIATGEKKADSLTSLTPTDREVARYILDIARLATKLPSNFSDNSNPDVVDAVSNLASQTDDEYIVDTMFFNTSDAIRDFDLSKQARIRHRISELIDAQKNLETYHAVPALLSVGFGVINEYAKENGGSVDQRQQVLNDLLKYVEDNLEVLSDDGTYGEGLAYLATAHKLISQKAEKILNDVYDADSGLGTHAAARNGFNEETYRLGIETHMKDGDASGFVKMFKPYAVTQGGKRGADGQHVRVFFDDGQNSVKIDRPGGFDDSEIGFVKELASGTTVKMGQPHYNETQRIATRWQQ